VPYRILHQALIDSILVNARIYADLHPLTELGSNPHVYQISITLLEYATTRPRYLQLSMICMVLGHYVAQLTNDPQSAEINARFYRYRGMAINSLNDALGRTAQATDDWLLLGVLMQMLVDVSVQSSFHGLD